MQLYGFLDSIGKVVTPPTNNLTTFLIAGQSNADGRVLLVNAPSWLNQSNPTVTGVKMWNINLTPYQFNDFKLGVNSGADVWTQTTWAFDMIAMHDYYVGKNTTVYMVKRTKGGTAIYIQSGDTKGCWNTDFTGITTYTTGNVLLQELQWYYQSAVTYATSIGKTLNVKSILWHQGEGDYLPQTAADAYYQNFKDVIYYIRNTIVGNSTLPIVYGSISRASAQYNATVEAAQFQIASEDVNAHCVNMSAGTLLDAYHFDATSATYFGDQVYNIIKNF